MHNEVKAYLKLYVFEFSYFSKGLKLKTSMSMWPHTGFDPKTMLSSFELILILMRTLILQILQYINTGLFPSFQSTVHLQTILTRRQRRIY